MVLRFLPSMTMNPYLMGSNSSERIPNSPLISPGRIVSVKFCCMPTAKT
jgi:hypothetical protein